MAQRGLARLEFALTVAVAGVLIALALAALTNLKTLGDEARQVSLEAHRAAASAVTLVHCQIVHPGEPTAHDCPPCPLSPTAMPMPGTASSQFIAERSCP